MGPALALEGKRYIAPASMSYLWGHGPNGPLRTATAPPPPESIGASVTECPRNDLESNHEHKRKLLNSLIVADSIALCLELSED